MGVPPITSTETTMSNEQKVPWSKPRTIFRRLTTKFNLRTYTSSQVPPNAFSKENREAALRERGLLPPRQSKDLSVQEMERDGAIPVVLANDADQRSSTESAAELIKKEWEAKNRLSESHQPQRVNSLNLGDVFSCPETPFIQLSLSESADSAAPASQAQPARESIPSSPADVAIPHLPSPSFEALLSPVPVSQAVTPLRDIPTEISAHLFPLPSSPKSVSSPNFELSFHPPSPTSVPLPRSPSLRTSLRSSLSGALTPSPFDNQGASLTPTPSTPFISITPCAGIYSDDTKSSPPHKRTESDSSCQPPSLDDNSGTTTDSESAAISGNGRLGGLDDEAHEGSCFNVPVIVESPIEDSFLEEQYPVMKPTSIVDANQAVLPPMSAPINGSEPRITIDAPRMNKRGVTDPTSGVKLNRMRSMNPFKRALSSAGYEDQLTTLSSGEPPQRRLTVKSSLSSLRRSVIGTLSRKPPSVERGSGGGGGKIVSDTLRSRTSLGCMMEEGEGDVEARTPVSPILYSRGHILMEASHIKDEESRRVTEMAFCI